MVRETLSDRLSLVSVSCCVCDRDEASLVGTGYDYEYGTSPDLFHAYRCDECGNVYLNPRPDESSFEVIYPSEYHALEFSQDRFKLIHKVRSRLEANRLLRYCEGFGPGARILDLGCGDGFHLKLLEEYGDKGWILEGLDVDRRAVDVASAKGLTVHLGDIDDVGLDEGAYDLVYTLQTIEHVANPDRFMRAVQSILKPGGRLVIVTDNTDSIDCSLFQRTYWGGYHFPRHLNLFNRSCLARLARKTGFEVIEIGTIVSPVNWVYSVHNFLVGKRAPRWLIDRFTLRSPVSLGFFTLVDMILQRVGRGALLNGFFRKPTQDPSGNSYPSTGIDGQSTKSVM